MRKLLSLAVITLLIAAISVYAVWTELRPSGHYLSDLRSQVALNQGQPSERGNLLGIQPELFSGDYQSVELLHLKLAAYLEKARNEGLLNRKTIAVLPEHIGTWLIASGEKAEVYQANTVREAMVWLAASHPLQLARALLAAQGEDRLTDALFRMKGKAMARDYQTLFGGLAKEFGITLVAGSIVLPEPRVENGALMVGTGPLYNISLVFGSDGTPLGQPQRKIFPIRDEQDFTAAAPTAALQVVDTPAGRLGVLICTDSWYPASYAELARSGVELLAVPAFLTGNGNWSKPWAGYNGASAPADVSLKPGELSEGEAWQRLAMATRLSSSGAQAGITVFLRGQLWDLGSDGQSLLATPSQHSLASDGRGARLINLWL
ncbi:carbon-nitrogen hydrolase family protein [Pseudomonas cavernicola]|uniref:Carbon-nitrogen hydrolase family protein n=1 Tax=Pseudomonas cavernicola TaxID=2320866 RepID=A0A418XMT6_9PSED|nr:carbon-nitrogen hydrolase family protein [Pseudomonas cavernicola]RJG13771.1 carbon-nitrogen hydrolase family protein [Pseudomonas cavernicola]